MADDIKWSETSPECVVEEAFLAFRVRDGYRLAALASPESLRQYREQVLSDLHPQWHIWTPEALRAHDPEMPMEAAEWQARRMEQNRAHHQDSLVRQFAGVQHATELEHMDAAELLDRALSAAPRQALGLGFCRILGHVQEGPDRAYVLFWMGADEEPSMFEEPLIAVLDRVADEWKLRIDPHHRWGVPGFRNIGFVGDDPPDE